MCPISRKLPSLFRLGGSVNEKLGSEPCRKAPGPVRQPPLYFDEMFRTARGFLLVAPPAFALTLISFLISHPHGAEAFVPYPFLADAMGQSLAKRPVARFTIAATVFFLLPYLVTGLLLFFADLGV